MCILRGDIGVLILYLESFGGVRVVGVGVRGVVSSLCLAFFFGGFCGGMGEEVWGWVCLSMFVVFFSGGGNGWCEGG